MVAHVVMDSASEMACTVVHWCYEEDRSCGLPTHGLAITIRTPHVRMISCRNVSGTLQPDIFTRWALSPMARDVASRGLLGSVKVPKQHQKAKPRTYAQHRLPCARSTVPSEKALPRLRTLVWQHSARPAIPHPLPSPRPRTMRMPLTNMSAIRSRSSLERGAADGT